ncbi:MAG: Sigma 54 modulation protein YhbH [Labilithrix sp.]|nr:Sigma 54 modulation protein YhbH [Labilithrix sp.]
MQSPVQVTFRDIPPSPALTAHVEKRAAKLDTFFDRIVKCHVVVEAPHRHSKHGKRFHCRIDLVVPGRELVVSRNPEDAKEDAYAAVDDAFGDAERVLEDFARVQQVDTKTHLKPPHGVVTKLFTDRGYGFIEAEDGHEVYFHQNSVLGVRFEKLAVGTRVRFAEEDGDKGPQASTVHVVGEG